MKLLVVGSKGFIGSHCAAYFSDAGLEVTGCDTLAPMEAEPWQYVRMDPGSNDFNELFKREKFDFCINAAGSAHVPYSFQFPEKDFEMNVSLVINLLGAIKNHAPTCRFINFSSAAVYGNPSSLPVSESSPVAPLSPYGYHKLLSENLLLEYHRFFSLRTCSLRVFSAYGEGLKKQLFWDLFQKLKESDSISLFGTGDESRDFIYITDLLAIVELIMKRSEFKGDIYNVANGEEITIRQAVQTFLEAFQWNGKFTFSGEEKKGDPKNWKAEIEKIRGLGYVRKTTFREGVENYARWLKESM